MELTKRKIEKPLKQKMRSICPYVCVYVVVSGRVGLQLTWSIALPNCFIVLDVTGMPMELSRQSETL